jgi:hypothetical protein
MIQETILRKIVGKPALRYVVSYSDDSPERAEAVAFFGAVRFRLAPELFIPPEVDGMSISDAQAYLDQHPIPRRWGTLSITETDSIADADLARLKFIPELTIVKVLSDRITDAGVHFLRTLHSVDILCLWSNSVTNACLNDLSELKSLRMLDVQRCEHISPLAFAAILPNLPKLERSWPPGRIRQPD